MRDFIIIILGMTIVAVALMSYVVAGFIDINKTDKCKKFEYISGIRTAMIDGNCYKFANNTFVKINFEEYEKWLK